MSEVVKSQIMVLESLDDLLRLIVSKVNQINSGHIYYFKKDGKHIYFVNQTIPAWYDLRGLPITLYAEGIEPKSNIIQFNLATDTTNEYWQFTENILTSARVVYIPIIRLKSVPSFII